MNWKSFLVPALIASGPAYLVCLGVYALFQNEKSIAQLSTCQSNLHQIGLAYQQYLQDAQGVSPPLSVNDEGWSDLLQPCAKSWPIFQCPSGAGTNKPHQTDYFYNARLAKVSKVPLPALTIAFGDGYDNCATNAHLLEWIHDAIDIERHRNGSNFVFVDGHVKWLRSDNVSNEPPGRHDNDWKVTFAVR